MRFKGYFSHIFFSVSFLLLISASVILWTVKYDIKIDIKENRRLASFPVYQKNIPKFNKQLDQYINDNIPLRKYVISWYHYIWNWHLRSPIVAYYVRGSDNYVFGVKHSLKPATMRISNPDVAAYKEVAYGMYNLAKYYNADFTYILFPDKESALPYYIPDWIKRFKEKHKILSLRELLLSQIKEPPFNFIDLLEYMKADKAGLETYFDKRIDPYHYNAKGLDLAVKLICEAINKKKIFYKCSDIKLNVEKKQYKSFPYHGKYGYEEVFRGSIEGDMSGMERIPYEKEDIFRDVDYIKNTSINNNSILILSDSSLALKSLTKLKYNKLILSRNILPFVFASSSYMHARNAYENYYEFLIDAINEAKIEHVVFGITERTLIYTSTSLRDPILRILGRYALGMNENFIFPKDLSSPYTPIFDKAGYLSVNNTSIFPLYIDKDLKTDINGDIYVSFRYSFPKNANKAVLEWTSDKEFKTDIKRSSVKISGGGCKV